MPTDPMVLARDERADLADLLATLTPEEWAAPTLCTGWRVRELVAHMVSYEGIGVGGLLRRLAASRGNPDRMNEIGVAAFVERSPDDLVALARSAPAEGLTAAFRARIALTDALIHHQDIRRPLGRPRTIPRERMSVVLDFARTAPPIGAPARIRGLALAASDLDWNIGRGPLVAGPAEALLMAMAGRRGIVGELSGDGVPILATRIGG